MAARRIALIAIRPAASSVRPEGNHLRWAFPYEAGFPPDGFLVYRRAATQKPRKVVAFTPGSAIAPEQSFGAGDERVTLQFPPAVQLNSTPEGTLAVNAAPDVFLELRFDAPVCTVRLDVRGAFDAILVQAMVDDLVVAEAEPDPPTADGTQVVQVSAPGFDRVLVPLAFTELLGVGFTTEAAVVADSAWGEPVATLEIPAPADTAGALARLPGELRNRYATSRERALARYGPNLPVLLDLVARCVVPFVEQAPLLADDPSSPLQAVAPQSAVLLAALDPNVARLLSLHWVDEYGAGTTAAQAGTAYDYRVDGRWADQTLSGLQFGVGRDEAELPRVTGAHGQQLPGLRFRDREARGRVGISWDRPRLSGTPGAQSAPVRYEVRRRSELAAAPVEVLLTAGSPVAMARSRTKSGGGYAFIDNDAPIGTHVYEVRGIDLFGQLGPPVATSPIQVFDRDAPAAPVRVRTALVQDEGAPARLEVSFELPAALAEASPDAREFRVYHRRDALVERLPVLASPEAIEDLRDGRLWQTLSIRDAAGGALSAGVLARFEGGRLAGPRGDPPVAASLRRQVPIERAPSDSQVLLAPAVVRIEKGPYELVSDPKDRRSWSELSAQRTPVRPPVTGLLRGVSREVAARVLRVDDVPGSTGALGELSQRERPRPGEAGPRGIGLALDLGLLETELFTAGTARVGGATHPVLYSTSGRGADDPDRAARVVLPENVIASEGQAVTLVAPADGIRPLERDRPPVHLRLVTIGVQLPALATMGGELVLAGRSRKRGRSVVLQVVSAPLALPTTFALLVRVRDEDLSFVDGLDSGDATCRYYAPYTISTPVDLAGSGGPGLDLAVLPAQASRTAYFALSTLDDRGNESALSLPSELRVVRPPPVGAPGRPFPCAAGPDARAGYATVSDRRGRATVCLRWTLGTLSPADGLRYEVARALDTTVVTASLGRWLQGDASPPVPLVAGRTLAGHLSRVRADEQSGLILAECAVDPPDAEHARFRGGRLVRGGLRFQVTAVGSAGAAKLDLALRPLGHRETPTAGPCRLDATPDAAAAATDAALLTLAPEVEDAFSLVTGAPLDTLNYVDEIPGSGRNRYFYRVRAVDAAGNRSAWSDVSAPFHQVDTKPPRAPGDVVATAGVRAATLAWSRDPDPSVTSWRVYRSEDPDEFRELSARAPVATVKARARGADPRRIVYVDQPLEALGRGRAWSYRVVAVRSVRTGPGLRDRLTLVSAPSRVVSAEVVDPTPPIPPADLAAVREVVGGVARVRLSWTSTTRTSFLVRRSTEASAGAVPVTAWLDGGELDAAAGVWRYTFDDSAVGPDPLVYTVKVRSRTGREAVSNPSGPA